MRREPNGVPAETETQTQTQQLHTILCSDTIPNMLHHIYVAAHVHIHYHLVARGFEGLDTEGERLGLRLRLGLTNDNVSCR